MKQAKRQLNIIIMSLLLCLSFGITVFATEGVKISNALTVTPIRIFFACVIIVAFVVTEILFSRIRTNRVEKRNNKK